MRTFVLIACATAVAACLRPATAFAADVDDFVAACTKSTNLTTELCRCTGENARKDLTADGFDYLVASLAGDQDTIDATRPKLGMEELMKSSLYMTKGTSKCAAQAAPTAEPTTEE